VGGFAIRYRGPIVRGGRKISLCAAAASALLAAGCGGGTRQDVGEPTAYFPMRVVRARFPLKQSIARETKLELWVRNTGHRTVPNVAVTIQSFEYTSQYPELADDKRPIWVIEQGPGRVAKPPVESEEVSLSGGAETAYVNTWAMGSLAPGRTRDFTWRVVPVKGGVYTVRYIVSAGLSGNAKAVKGIGSLTRGSPVEGKFAVYIRPAPKVTHVNPNTGRVEVGQIPATP
jgi:hypothetical protein